MAKDKWLKEIWLDPSPIDEVGGEPVYNAFTDPKLVPGGGGVKYRIVLDEEQPAEAYTTECESK